MKALHPTTPATREAAGWWLSEVRAVLPAGTPPRDVAAVLHTEAARVSHVVLSVACSLAGAGGADLAWDALVARRVAVEERRVAAGAR